MGSRKGSWHYMLAVIILFKEGINTLGWRSKWKKSSLMLIHFPAILSSYEEGEVSSISWRSSNLYAEWHHYSKKAFLTTWSCKPRIACHCWLYLRALADWQCHAGNSCLCVSLGKTSKLISVWVSCGIKWRRKTTVEKLVGDSR